MTDNNIRSSFSQHEVFETCPKTWYYKYVKKIPTADDFVYAHAGSVIHDVLENWYKGKYKDILECKEYFLSRWKDYNLPTSILKHKKDIYWEMCLNGINLNKVVKDTELKLSFPEITAYIDAVCDEEELVDWKSSTRTEVNEKSYKKQLKVYAWLYKRQTGKIPKKCTVYYLKYNNSNKQLSFSFTEEDIKEIETWYNDILERMKNIREGKEEVPDWNFDYQWCPYKHLWRNEETYYFSITKHKNNIYLKGPITKLLERGINKKFSYELKNSFFIQKRYPGMSTIVSFWNNKYKSLPISMYNELIKTLEDYAKFNKKKLEITTTDNRMFDTKDVETPKSFLNDIKLRPHQKIAVDKFLEKKMAILELATGAGKTEIAFEIIRKLKIPTLFIVDKVDLLNQTVKRLKESLGIEAGIIGKGKKDIKDITIATVQTLIKNINTPEIKEYLNNIRFVIFDECHKVASKSYLKISYQLYNSEYRLGLSATAWRNDGNDMAINAVAGYTCYKVSAEDLIEKGYLEKPNITFVTNYLTEEEEKELKKELEKREFEITDKHYGSDYDGTAEIYAAAYNVYIKDNEPRNNVVKKIVTNNKNKKVLILVKNISHGERLSEILDAVYINGNTNKKDRQKLIDNFTTGDLNILIGTISIFSEGLDVPKLEVLINAAGNKGDIKSIQVLGRLLRKHTEKKGCDYYDFDDTYDVYMKNAAWKRKWTFKKQGHKVKIVKFQNI